MKASLGFCAAFISLLASLAVIAGPDAQPLKPQLRRPVAAAYLDDRLLCVANRCGTLSLVDLPRLQVVDEFAVAKQLNGLAITPDRKLVLVVDEERHELVALRFDGTKLIPRARRAVAPFPVSVIVSPDGKWAAVASLWSRRVEVVDPSSLQTLHVIRLPFAPRDQCVLPDGFHVTVADAFGGHLAVIDASAGRIVTMYELNGHNLRGLAVSPDHKYLFISHQVLNSEAATTRENIERGVLMANVLLLVPIAQLLQPSANLETAARTIALGKVGAGAGDPAGVAAVSEGQVAVALAGVHELALVRLEGGKTTQRIPVGHRPTAVLAAPAQPLVVVNTFSDSLSLVDARQGAVMHTLTLGPQPELSFQERGEQLFYDAKLSHDGWLSCHSCHTDGHTNGLLSDTKADGTFGTPKRTLTLLGTGMTDLWGWNGQFKYLHDQVQASLDGTVHSPGIPYQGVSDLVSFLAALPPPPPLEPATANEEDRVQVERGRRIFERQECSRCHVGPLTYTSHGTYNVGFADERGLRMFNPPSLRGVGQGYRFLHDGRAATLEEVFQKYRHKVPADMSAEERQDLLRFLRSL